MVLGAIWLREGIEGVRGGAPGYVAVLAPGGSWPLAGCAEARTKLPNASKIELTITTLSPKTRSQGMERVILVCIPPLSHKQFLKCHL